MMKLSKLLQESKYLKIHFFHIALRDGVNSRTKLEMQNQSTNLKGTRFLIYMILTELDH